MKKQKTKPKAFASLLGTMVLALFASQHLNSGSLVRAQACLGETPMYGQAKVKETAKQQLGYISDKTDTRLSKIDYCIATSPMDGDTHFRGFLATFSYGGGSKQYQFGGYGDPEIDDCQSVSFTDEIHTNGLVVYSDLDDIEGFKLLDNTGYFWEFKTATGGIKSKLSLIYGPIVGFRMITQSEEYSNSLDEESDETEVYENVPIYLSVIYNTCACSMSSFRADSPPEDMSVRASNSPQQQQFLFYQKDTIGFNHGQDCGSYSVSLYPEMPFLSLSSTGVSGPRDRPYTDLLMLSKTSIFQIGVWDMQLKIEQIEENGDGFQFPSFGVLDPIIYEFKVVIEPCEFSSYEIDVAPTQLVYTIGSETIEGGNYMFVDDQGCGYPEEVSFVGLPDFVGHRITSHDFIINKFDDLSLAGSYPVTIQSEISYPTSALDFTIRNNMATHEIEFVIIDPCKETELLLDWTTESVFVTVGTPAFTITLPVAQDSKSQDYEESNGTASYCGPRIYEILGPSILYEKFLTIVEEDAEGRTFQIDTSNNVQAGQYSIIIQASLQNYPEEVFPVELLLEITIDQTCLVSQYEAKFEKLIMTYIIGDREVTAGFYDFEEVGSDCGYPQQTTIQNLPDFAVHYPVEQDFTIPFTENLTLTGTYQVQINSQVWHPTSQFDPTPIVYDASTSLEIIMVDPCESTQILDWTISPVNTSVGADLLEITLPEVQDQSSQQYGLKKDGLQLCGPRIFQLNTDSQVYTNFMSFDDDRTLIIQPISFADIGEFQIKVSVSLENYPQIEHKETTFLITIDPCQVVQLEISQVPQPITYIIGDKLESTGGFYAFTEAISSCNYPQVISFTDGLPDFIVHNEETQDFTIPFIQDLSLAASYKVQIVSTISHVTSATNPTIIQIFATVDLEIELIDPCNFTKMLEWTTEPIFMTVSTEISRSSLPQATDQSSLDYGSLTDGLSLCGPRSYQILTASSVYESFMSIEVIEGEAIALEISPSSLEYAGEYKIQIQASLKNYPEVQPVQLMLEIKIDQTCQVSQYEAEFTTLTMTYIIGDEKVTAGFYNFIEVGSDCDYPEHITVTNLPDFITHNEESQDFTIAFTEDLNLAGTYQVQIDSQVSHQTSSIDSNLDIHYASTTLEIILVNSCLQTQMLDWTKEPISALAGAQAFTVNLPTPNDLSSLQYGGIKDGISLCGPRQYQIITPASVYEKFIQFQEDGENSGIAIIIDPSEQESTSQYQVKIQATLENYPEVQPVELTLSITIDLICDVNQYEAEQTTQSLTYVIGDNEMTGGFYNFVQIGSDCNYDEVVTIKDLPIFVNHNAITQDFTIPFTDKLVLAGLFVVQIESEISYETSAIDATLIKYTATSTLEIIFLNPCESTRLFSWNISPISTRLGADAMFFTISDPLDSASIEFGEIKDGFSFCGPRAIEVLTDDSIYQSFLTFQDQKTFTIDPKSEADIGQYKIQLRASLDNYEEVATKVTTLSITIDPCLVTKFEVVLVPQPLTYIIGDTKSSTGGFYDFAEVDSQCGYPQKIEIKDQPGFLVHKVDAKEFTIPFNTDVSLAGTYLVQIKSKISHTISAMDSMTVELEAMTMLEIVLVDPCIQTQMLEWTIETISTSVGAKTLNVILTEARDQTSLDYGNKNGLSLCGARIYEVISEPQLYQRFLEFDGVKTLTIQSRELTSAGDHIVQMIASLANYPQIQPTETSVNIKIGQCLVDTLSYDQTPVQVYNLHQTSPFTFSFSDFQQNPDCNYQLSYEIMIKDRLSQEYSTLPNFIESSDENSTFTVYSTDLEDIGTYLISIIGRVPSLFQSSEVTVKAEMLIELEIANVCHQHSIVSDFTVEPIDYFIGGTGAIDINPTWIESPSSAEAQGCPFEYDVFLLEDGEQRSFTAEEMALISLDSETGQIRIENKNDRTVQGQFWTIVILKRSSFSQSQNREAKAQFIVNWIYSCSADEVDVVFYSQNVVIEYKIGLTGVIQEQPLWSQKLSDCPIQYEIFIIQNGIESPINAKQSSLISIADQTTGSIKILNEAEYEYQGLSWQIKVQGTSLNSTQNKRASASVLFSIQWKDPCQESRLAPPYFKDIITEPFKLYGHLSISYVSMKDLTYGKECGGYTNSFKYISGPAFDGSDPYNANLSAMFTLDSADGGRGVSALEFVFQGDLTDRSWLGTHQFQIQSRNGVFNPSSQRGVNGLFKEVYSGILTIQIIDPCLTAIINSDNQLVLQDMTAQRGIASLESEIYVGASNSVDLLKKKQIDQKLCGRLSYTILTKDMKTFNGDWFKIQQQHEGYDPDSFSFSLHQNPLYSRVIFIDFYLKMKLKDYPMAEEVFLPITVSQMECEPNDFTFNVIENQKIQVGDQSKFIEFSLSQAPCDYQIKYSAFLLTERGEFKTVLPSFITFDPVSHSLPGFVKFDPVKHVIVLHETTDADFGNYIVGIFAELNDNNNMTVNTAFRVDVLAQEIENIDEIIDQDIKDEKEEIDSDKNDSSSVDPKTGMPTWLEKLEDQKLVLSTNSNTSSQSLLYQIGLPVDLIGQKMLLNAYLGEASRFASFDYIDNTISIDSSKLKDSDVGSYEIHLFATSISQRYKLKEFHNSFTLTILKEETAKPIQDGSENEKEPDENETDNIDESDPDSEDEVIQQLTTQFQGEIYESFREEPFDAAEPIPYIVDLSVNGVLKIGWDQAMQTHQNITQIQDQKVAIRNWQNKSERYSRRKLLSQKDQDIILLQNDTTRLTEEFKIFDSLEILLRNQTTDESIEQPLKWTLMEFSQDYSIFQIDIEDPNSIASNNQEYSLVVNFWGVDFFKGQSAGRSVRFGTELNWIVYRQISKDDQEQVDKLNDSLYYVKLAVILLCLLICILGNSLPTWMFLNTLQLIAHLPLLNTMMPANLNQFLQGYLDFVRLNMIKGLSWDLEDNFDASRKFWASNDIENHQVYSNNNTLLQLCGYGNLFVNNTVVILCLLTLVGLAWLLLVFKDRVFRKGTQSRRTEVFISNLALRLFYFCFLELTICVLISLQYPADFSSTMAGLQWITSIAVLILLIIFVSFIVSKLFRNGPYVDGFYKPLSFSAMICWSKREQDQGFDTRKHLRENKLKQQQKKGKASLPLAVDPLDFRVPLEKIKLEQAVKIGSGLKQQQEELSSSISSERKGTSDNWIGEHIYTDRPLMDSSQSEDQNESIIVNIEHYDESSTGVRKEIFRSTDHQNNHAATMLSQSQLESNFTSNRQEMLISNELNMGFRHKFFFTELDRFQNGRSHRTSQQQSNSILPYENQTSKLIQVHKKAFKKQQLQKDEDEQLYEGGENDLNRSSDDQKRVLEAASIKEQARSNVSIQSTVQVPLRQKTLYKGLKLNHERNVAVVHPLFYLLRRVLLAFIFVHMNTMVHTGLFLYMGFTLLMLAYVCIEHQWNETAINNQHIANEITIYVFCLFMVCFNCTEMRTETRFALGYSFIGVFLAWMSFNLTVIIWKALQNVRLLLRRNYLKSVNQKVAVDIGKTIRELKNSIEKGLLADIFHNQESQYSSQQSSKLDNNADLESQKMQKFKPRVVEERTCCGGIRVCICLYPLQAQKEENDPSKDQELMYQKTDQTKHLSESDQAQRNTASQAMFQVNNIGLPDAFERRSANDHDNWSFDIELPQREHDCAKQASEEEVKFPSPSNDLLRFDTHENDNQKEFLIDRNTDVNMSNSNSKIVISSKIGSLAGDKSLQSVVDSMQVQQLEICKDESLKNSQNLQQQLELEELALDCCRDSELAETAGNNISNENKSKSGDCLNASNDEDPFKTKNSSTGGAVTFKNSLIDQRSSINNLKKATTPGALSEHDLLQTPSKRSQGMFGQERELFLSVEKKTANFCQESPMQPSAMLMSRDKKMKGSFNNTLINVQAIDSCSSKEIQSQKQVENVQDSNLKDFNDFLERASIQLLMKNEDDDQERQQLEQTNIPAKSKTTMEYLTIALATPVITPFVERQDEIEKQIIDEHHQQQQKQPQECKEIERINSSIDDDLKIHITEENDKVDEMEMIQLKKDQNSRSTSDLDEASKGTKATIASKHPHTKGSHRLVDSHMFSHIFSPSVTDNEQSKANRKPLQSSSLNITCELSDPSLPEEQKVQAASKQSVENMKEDSGQTSKIAVDCSTEFKIPNNSVASVAEKQSNTSGQLNSQRKFSIDSLVRSLGRAKSQQEAGASEEVAISIKNMKNKSGQDDKNQEKSQQQQQQQLQQRSQQVQAACDKDIKLVLSSDDIEQHSNTNKNTPQSKTNQQYNLTNRPCRNTPRNAISSQGHHYHKHNKQLLLHQQSTPALLNQVQKFKTTKNLDQSPSNKQRKSISLTHQKKKNVSPYFAIPVVIPLINKESTPGSSRSMKSQNNLSPKGCAGLSHYNFNKAVARVETTLFSSNDGSQKQGAYAAVVDYENLLQYDKANQIVVPVLSMNSGDQPEPNQNVNNNFMLGGMSSQNPISHIGSDNEENSHNKYALSPKSHNERPFSQENFKRLHQRNKTLVSIESFDRELKQQNCNSIKSDKSILSPQSKKFKTKNKDQKENSSNANKYSIISAPRIPIVHPTPSYKEDYGISPRADKNDITGQTLKQLNLYNDLAMYLPQKKKQRNSRGLGSDCLSQKSSTSILSKTNPNFNSAMMNASNQHHTQENQTLPMIKNDKKDLVLRENMNHTNSNSQTARGRRGTQKTQRRQQTIVNIYHTPKNQNPINNISQQQQKQPTAPSQVFFNINLQKRTGQQILGALPQVGQQQPPGSGASSALAFTTMKNSEGRESRNQCLQENQAFTLAPPVTYVGSPIMGDEAVVTQVNSSKPPSSNSNSNLPSRLRF